jgi:uncharacterized membrane protein
MSTLIAALFTDSKNAGEAVADLKNQGFTKDISIISKEYEGFEVDTSTHQIKQQVKDGAAGGALIGAAIGGLATVLAGITAITIPGAGIFIAGPLASAATGAAAGALAGTLVGVLVDKGIPDKEAKLYEDRIAAGDTLIAVTASSDKVDEVLNVLINHGVDAAEIGRFDV